jgi:hypothetical protein
MSVYTGAYRILESSMKERFGVRFKIYPNVYDHSVRVAAQYQATWETDVEEQMHTPTKMVETMIDACAAVKMRLCAKVQEELMNLGDVTEQRQIVDNAYRYRLACQEMQMAWERFKKCPKDSAAGEYVRAEFDKASEAAKTWREKLVILAAGGHDLETLR